MTWHGARQRQERVAHERTNQRILSINCLIHPQLLKNRKNLHGKPLLYCFGLHLKGKAPHVICAELKSNQVVDTDRCHLRGLSALQDDSMGLCSGGPPLGVLAMTPREQKRDFRRRFLGHFWGPELAQSGRRLTGAELPQHRAQRVDVRRRGAWLVHDLLWGAPRQ